MASGSTTRATLDDLYSVEGKAELVGGRIVQFMASGDLPTDVAFEISVSLRAYVKATGQGVAKTDGIGYAVPELPSGRESFSPNASYFTGPRPVNRMRFIEGPPNFAAEVRSENDYGNAAELEMAAKREDYFTAGTQVVWDVDPLAETIAVYRANNPTRPVIYRRGDIAEAEPAVPGWRLAVADLFPVQSSGGRESMGPVIR
ncbi:MAG: Uma2 family endonuclease [Gemmataceae bacterium]|nr:Uma2 family endonuclease [Gemmataceae bacterium]